jgi:LemA protein
MIALWLPVAIIVLIVAYFISTYNALIRLKNQIKNAWAQIDVQLKRRHDLIPNLIETVRGYMMHERQTLENITIARSKAMSAESIPEKGKAEGLLSQALGRFYAVAEGYPDLKANQNFLALQEELTSTENRIAFARQSYNDQVLFFNNKIQMFPSNMVAGWLNYRAEHFFELEDKAQREVPKVDFSS